MPDTSVLIIVCALIAVVAVYASRKRDMTSKNNESFVPEVKRQASSTSVSIRIRESRSFEEDGAFEQLILSAQSLPVEKYFYTKLVGTSHANDDGSSRVRAISACNTGANLGMRLEPENPFDPNAVAIMFGNRQLGYLDARLAGETTRDIKRNGFRYGVYMKKPTLHPKTKRVVGAVLLIIRFTKESAVQIK